MVSLVLSTTNLVSLTIVVAPKIKLPVDQNALNSVTRGLVGDSSFAVLPNIPPKMTFALTLLFQMVGFHALPFNMFETRMTNAVSYASLNSSFSQHGKHSSELSRFAATLPSSSDGMFTRRLSF